MNDWLSQIVGDFKESQVVLENTAWKRALSLAQNVPAEGGRVAAGTWPQVSKSLAEAGVVGFKTGKPITPDWLSGLYRVGRVGLETVSLQQYPVRVVDYALAKSDGDGEQALLLLKAREKNGEGIRLHDLSNGLVTGTPKVADALAIIERLPEEQRAEVARVVAPTPAHTSPGAVVRAFDSLNSEQREMVVQDIVQHREFAEAVRSNPTVRDEMLVSVMGTPEQRQERREEIERQSIASHPLHGWRQVGDGLGEMNLGGHHALTALTKLAINAEINPDDDMLRVAHSRAEQVGRTIYEIEMAWGETPITDKIEELRGQRV